MDFIRTCLSALIIGCLIAFTTAPILRAQDAPLEHPVIRPMNGASLNENASRLEEFGQLSVNYLDANDRSVTEIAQGRFRHLEYQLEDISIGRSEIIANYAAEIARVGGEVISQRTTRLRFRIFNSNGATTWGILDTRRDGAYQLEILDEASLVQSLEFDAEALQQALETEGRVNVYGILFDIDSANLRPGSGAILDTLAEVLKTSTTLRVEIRGHTDSTGGAEHNRALSLERAQRVTEALSLFGVTADRMVAVGMGADAPIATNDTEEGRQQNRRVELVKVE